MMVSEQQKNSKEYKVKQTVYLIVVMTLPYKFNDLTGEAVKEEVVVTKFCSQNLNGKNIPIYGHRMVCLNPNHPEPNIPPEIRDWLDLFYQSIHSPERPSINWNNAGIKRAADLIDYEKLTPEQRKNAKDKEQGEVVRSIYIQEGVVKVAKNAITEGLNNDIIIKLTGLSNEEIEMLRKEE